MRFFPSLLIVPLLFVACKDNSKAAPSDASANAETSTSTAGDASTSATVSEADVKKLLEKWLAAQNAGTFSAYEALYAPRFEGVRRSGSQTARLDRARWMKEREKMFEKKTTVEAKDVSITPSHEGADVRFVQSWAQERYKDEGPKRMVLTRVKGDLKIAREELLRSTVKSPSSISPDRFAFAIHSPNPQLVLSDAPKDEWMTGAIKTASLAEPVVTRRVVDERKLPPELGAWIGKSVELFNADGTGCHGKVSALAVVARVTPHFGTRAAWTGTGDFQGEAPLPPAEVAKEAWGLAGNDGQLLVAEIKSTEGDCKNTLWGRAEASAKAVVAQGKPGDAKLRAQAIAELKKTKAWAETQARYESEKEPTDPKEWADYDSKTTLHVFVHPSGTTLVTLSISAGAGCGSFGGLLSAAWEQRDGALVLVKEPNGDDLSPRTAGDFDGDGTIDLLSPEILYRKKSGKYEPTNKLVVPFLDCGC